jgi:hypothetical protein
MGNAVANPAAFLWKKGAMVMKHASFFKLVLVAMIVVPVAGAQTGSCSGAESTAIIDFEQSLHVGLPLSVQTRMDLLQIGPQTTEMDTCACNGAKRYTVTNDCGGGRKVQAPCYIKYILGTTTECARRCQPAYNACKGDPDPGCS